jgi:hypothetical protein
MALARVVTFENVDEDRIAEVRGRIDGGEPPEGLPASELLVLHDPAGSKAIAIVFFDSEDDYAKGDAVLGGLPAEDTPGKRTSVGKYEVAVRRAV